MNKVRSLLHVSRTDELRLFSVAEKQANRGGAPASKDGEDLEQVVGNAEDEIGDRIASIRETELLYGPDSLLAAFGPMIVHICGSPHKFKVRSQLPYPRANLD